MKPTIKIEGLDELDNTMDEASGAFAGIDAELGDIVIEDRGSVDAAIERIDRAIDARIATAPGNVMVAVVGAGLKETWRTSLLDEHEKAIGGGS